MLICECKNCLFYFERTLHSSSGDGGDGQNESESEAPRRRRSPPPFQTYFWRRFAALSFLTSRKRLYFGLDEAQNRLLFYTDKADFDRHQPAGSIALDGAICVPTANSRIFILQ